MDNVALRWLKTYSMDEGMLGRWITALGRFNMRIEHRTRDKHFNADGLSKKTEFYQEREERRAAQPDVKPVLSFISQDLYDSLELTL